MKNAGAKECKQGYSTKRCPQKQTKENLKPKKKIFRVLPLTIALCILCFACFAFGRAGEKGIASGIRDRAIREKFQNDYLILTEGTTSEKSILVFGERYNEPKDDITSILAQYGIESPATETKETEGYGVFDAILDRVAITATRVERVNDSYVVTYVVAAPDLTRILTDAKTLNENWTPDNFANYIISYIKDAEISNSEATVTYKKVDGVVTVNYQTPEFINSVTGGLLNVYSQAFTDLVNSLQEVSQE